VPFFYGAPLGLATKFETQEMNTSDLQIYSVQQYQKKSTVNVQWSNLTEE